MSRARIAGPLLLLALALVPVVASAAPTDAQVRRCVEGNLVRYGNPDTAVAAQYSDLEDQCRAALEGGVTVQVTPDGSDGSDGSGAGRPGASGGDGGGSTAPGAAAGATDGGGGTAPSGPRAPSTGTPATGSPAPAGAASDGGGAAAVAAAIAEADAGSGSPFTTTADAVPGWLAALLVVLAAGGLAAVVADQRGRAG